MFTNTVFRHDDIVLDMSELLMSNSILGRESHVYCSCLCGNNECFTSLLKSKSKK